MKGLLLRVLTLLTAVFLSAGLAQSQIAPNPPPPITSIDVLANQAQLAFVGTIEQSTQVDALYVDVKFKVIQTLKGPAIPDTVRVSWTSDLEKWQKGGSLLLVTTPFDPRGSVRFLDLSNPRLAAMTADLKLLRKPDDIIAAFTAAVSKTGGKSNTDSYPVPVDAKKVEGTTLDNRNSWSQNKSVVHLAVPIDARLEFFARQEAKSSEIFRRIDGAQALAYFPSPGNIALLRTLLDDQGWQPSTYRMENKLLYTEYNTVRRTAFESLIRMGVKVEESLSLRPQATEERVRSLELDSGNVSLEDIGQATHYKELEYLYLSNANVPQYGFSVVAQIRSLKALFLESSNVEDEDLKTLSVLPRLRYIGLTNTAVTDEGLLALAKFKSLKKVDVGNRVTAEGVAALRRLRPDMVVRPDEFEFLNALRPRRMEAGFKVSTWWFLPVAQAALEAAGFRCEAFIFPRETAEKVGDLLREKLPKLGWTSYPTEWSAPTTGPYRLSVPIVGTYGSRTVDRVYVNTKQYGRPDEALGIRANSGERLILVVRNVDP